MADELPWIQWYPARWLGDTGLRQCSSAARGLWIDILMFMHTCTPYGHFVIRGKAPTFRQIASLIGGITEAQVKSRLTELEEAGVFDRTEEGIVISRRMIRDNARRMTSRANGAKGGNPNLRAGLTQEVNQNTEPRLTQPVNPRSNPPVNSHVNGEDNALREEKIREEKRRERERSAGASAHAALAPKTIIPEDWVPDEDGVLIAKESGISDLVANVEKFVDYYAADGTPKADWQAQWRRWCRREPELRRNAR